MEWLKREGSLHYEFEVEEETRIMVAPLRIEDFTWTTHVIDAYDRSGRARIRIKNGEPRFSVKIPLFTRDTATSKSCLRLELKPADVEQKCDLFWMRQLILAEAGAQCIEKWGCRLTLPNGVTAWLNRDNRGDWWFELDRGQEFVPPPGFIVLGHSKSAIAT